MVSFSGSAEQDLDIGQDGAPDKAGCITGRCHQRDLLVVRGEHRGVMEQDMDGRLRDQWWSKGGRDLDATAGAERGYVVGEVPCIKGDGSGTRWDALGRGFAGLEAVALGVDLSPLTDSTSGPTPGDEHDTLNWRRQFRRRRAKIISRMYLWEHQVTAQGGRGAGRGHAGRAWWGIHDDRLFR